jgi:alanyl-tRNA synthetase
VLDHLKKEYNDFSGVVYDPYHETSLEVGVLAILVDGQPVESAAVGDRVEVVLRKTPFYVEAGGQVSDTGTIRGESRMDGNLILPANWIVDVEDTRRPVSGLIIHVGEVVEGYLEGEQFLAKAEVDAERRLDIMRNHTATHLLHAQLRSILGTHVQQKGSLVAPDRLRFDFSHDAPLSEEETLSLMTNINDAVMANMPVVTVEKDLQTARSEGAMALFGEKYGDIVRTVTIQNNGSAYSYELCGGTHVPSTGIIGPFVITSEGSVAQGTRRVEALTGHTAQQYINRQFDTLRRTASQLGATPDQIATRVDALREEIAEARQDNARLRRNLARLDFERLLEKVEKINNVPVLIAQVQPTTPDTLREMTDWFRDKQKQGVVVLGTVNDAKPQLIAAVTDDLTKRVHAGNLIKAVAGIVGGGGGGRPNMAQAGGKDASKLDEALQQAHKLVVDALSK